MEIIFHGNTTNSRVYMFDLVKKELEKVFTSGMIKCVIRQDKHRIVTPFFTCEFLELSERSRGMKCDLVVLGDEPSVNLYKVINNISKNYVVLFEDFMDEGKHTSSGGYPLGRYVDVRSEVFYDAYCKLASKMKKRVEFSELYGKFSELGITVKDKDGNFKSVEHILNEISGKYSEFIGKENELLGGE